VPPVFAELKTTVREKIQAACGVGEKKAREALTKLIVDEKVFEIPVPNPKGGRNYAGVVRSSAAS
jgi:hypothetical protein